MLLNMIIPINSDIQLIFYIDNYACSESKYIFFMIKQKLTSDDKRDNVYIEYLILEWKNLCKIESNKNLTIFNKFEDEFIYNGSNKQIKICKDSENDKEIKLNIYNSNSWLYEELEDLIKAFCLLINNIDIKAYIKIIY